MVANAPLTIELSDIQLCATPRDELDWSEGPAQARDWVAKQAELAAAEIAKLSKRSGWGRWSVIEYAVTYLVNHLQFSLTNLHVQFCDAPTSAKTPGPVPKDCNTLGLRVDSIATVADSQSLSYAVSWLFRRASQVSHVLYTRTAQVPSQSCQCWCTQGRCTSGAGAGCLWRCVAPLIFPLTTPCVHCACHHAGCPDTKRHTHSRSAGLHGRRRRARNTNT